MKEQYKMYDQRLEQTKFNVTELLEYLEENGFNAFSKGGTYVTGFFNGKINRDNHDNLELIGHNHNVSTCSAELFIRTLRNVEDQFEYQLFGDN